MRHLVRMALPLLAMSSVQALAQTGLPVAYPETRRDAIVEDHFGIKVADPYRWLEKDSAEDPAVAAWVAAETRTTDAYVATLPGRDILRRRIKALYDYERFTVPIVRGGRIFYTRNSGMQGQSPLYVRDTADGPERLVLDPNSWSKDGATALADMAISHDGKKIVYGVQDGGSDWRTFHVVDVDSGKVLPDEIKWGFFTALEWMKDGSGFFYCRLPAPKSGEALTGLAINQGVYFHRLGTPQSQDRLVYSRPDRPEMFHSFELTDDGRYLVLSSTGDAVTNDLVVFDLATRDWKPRMLVGEFDAGWWLVGNVGSKLFFRTSRNAPNGKIATIDLAAPKPAAVDLVPEQKPTLTSASLVGGRLLLSYLVDVTGEVRRYTLDGKPDGLVALPGRGTIDGFARGNGGQTYFSFTDFNVPLTIYRYDVATNRSQVWAQPKVPIDLSRIIVERTFYTSKDGTRVPIEIVRRKDVTGPAPTILYGYGGFMLIPEIDYMPERVAWVEQGGVFAVAHMRGGAEYGRAWNIAGRREKKQNVFDDFIAAGEFLKAKGITRQDGLAIQGLSNGGLLIGAVVNQRPDLYAAALPMVGVQDMLRFDQFTSGRMWAGEYGSPQVEADFRNLIKYSPYHNIRSGVAYPATLTIAADGDNRVVPGHSFKYTAALQAADPNGKPHLIHIQTRAGHTHGKPVDMIAAETADMWAFVAKWTGLAIKPID